MASALFIEAIFCFKEVFASGAKFLNSWDRALEVLMTKALGFWDWGIGAARTAMARIGRSNRAVNFMIWWIERRRKWRRERGMELLEKKLKTSRSLQEMRSEWAANRSLLLLHLYLRGVRLRLLNVCSCIKMLCQKRGKRELVVASRLQSVMESWRQIE